jgi:hypothetical protein
LFRCWFASFPSVGHSPASFALLEGEIIRLTCAVCLVTTDTLLLKPRKIRAFVLLSVGDRFGGIAGGFGERNGVRWRIAYQSE